MTRLPQITAEELIRFLKSQGFQDVRQSGSHRTLFYAVRNILVTVPVHTGCDIGRGLAIRILKDAGFSVDDFMKLR